MAKPEKRGGSYSTRVSLTDPLTGDRTQKRVTARTKRDLDAKVAALRVSWNAGTYLEPNETRLLDYIADYYRKGIGTGGPHTLYQTDSRIKNHVALDPVASIPIGRLKLQHMQDFADRLVASGLKVSSARLVMRTVSKPLARAMKLGTIAANPCQGVEWPHEETTPPAILTAEQTRHLIDGTREDEFAALWVLAATVGLRIGELLALRWDDIDLSDNRLTVSRTMTRTRDGKWALGESPKSDRSRRTIVLPAICTNALKLHRIRQLERRLALDAIWVESGAVFDNGTGAHFSHSSRIARRFDRLTNELGLPRVKFHALRHTAATLALRRGVQVHVVSRMLGHSDASITLRVYSHVLPDMEQDAAARIDSLYA